MMYLVFKEVPGVTVIEQEGQSLPVTLLRRKGSEFLVRAKERGDGRSLIRAFQVVHWLKKKKNLPANSGDTRDADLIPQGWEDPLE